MAEHNGITMKVVGPPFEQIPNSDFTVISHSTQSSLCCDNMYDDLLQTLLYLESTLEQERKRVDEERKRAYEERKRVDEERKRADKERKRAERVRNQLAKKLHETKEKLLLRISQNRTNVKSTIYNITLLTNKVSP